jgi:hypothetical protein
MPLSLYSSAVVPGVLFMIVGDVFSRAGMKGGLQALQGKDAG